MKNQNARRLAAAVWITLLLASVAGARADDLFSVEGTFERTLKVTGPVDLAVKTGSGTINVRPGDASTVRVTAKVKVRRSLTRDAEEVLKQITSNPPVEQNGDVIRIGYSQDEELYRNVSISYEIQTPAATKLRSQTGSGSQSIEAIAGPLEASTGSGNLTLGRIGGDTRASTGSGEISLDDIKGTLNANTGSGSIRGTRIGGAITASTGSGEITLEQTATGNVDVRTGSGSVELTGVRGAIRARTGSGSIRAQGEPAGAWSLHTASGGITVRLPAGASFDLDAHTSSGSIHTNHPVTVEGEITKRSVRGKVRGGGPRLELSTASGSIQIE